MNRSQSGVGRRSPSRPHEDTHGKVYWIVFATNPKSEIRNTAGDKRRKQINRVINRLLRKERKPNNKGQDNSLYTSFLTQLHISDYESVMATGTWLVKYSLSRMP